MPVSNNYLKVPRGQAVETVNADSTSTPEAKIEIKRFTQEEREVLAKEGLRAVYTLSGETIQMQKDAGRRFWYIASSDSGQLLSVQSMFSEVAFDPRPSKFFLPKSNNSTLDQQLEMIAEYSHNLQRKLGTQTVEAVIGEAPDYTQIAFAHLDVTRKRLFGSDYNYNYARTKTPTVGSSVAGVGYFDDVDGLDVDVWRRGHGLSLVWAVPLVVPSGSR